jgi:two-component system, NtrC family, response regulator AtoC
MSIESRQTMAAEASDSRLGLWAGFPDPEPVRNLGLIPPIPIHAQPPSSERPFGPDAPEEYTFELGERRVLVADPDMAQAYRKIARLAPTDLSVLVIGETGTGKELVASAIRLWSKRWNRPFVTINCAALPDTLAESELFGYERGAFSGAGRAKPGLLESAEGGTVLLDEVGDLSLPVQAKLLRALETGCVTRLGSVSERAVDFRLVAATNRPLDQGVRAGWFRDDLYYRLSAAVVRVPPLRARQRELPLLARRFLDDARRTNGMPSLPISEEAMAQLLAHDWPGNVRELRNLMEYLAAVTEDVLTPAQVAQNIGGCVSPAPSPTPLPIPIAPVTSGSFQSLAEANRESERRIIHAALAETRGNKTRAAKLLKVPLRTFMDKLKRHGIR